MKAYMYIGKLHTLVLSMRFRNGSQYIKEYAMDQSLIVSVDLAMVSGDISAFSKYWISEFPPPPQVSKI